MEKIDAAGIGIRFIFALILVLLTYNPSGYSYVGWLQSVFPSVGPVLVLSGVGLSVGWVIYLRATLRSLGIVGLILSSSLFACIVWLLVDRGIMDLGNLPVLSWVILVFVAAILALGMSWSLVRRRMSGQVDMDDVDD